MRDLDTFLSILHVLVDDALKAAPVRTQRPGSKPGLSASEVATLGMAAQWKQFPSERAFVRYALRHLRSAFPGLPDRSQLNRLICSAHDSLVTVMLGVAHQLGSAQAAYEVLDGMGVAVHNHKRSASGWLDSIAGIGWSNRLGWYDGFHLLTTVTPEGVLMGYAVAPAQTKEQPYAEDFLAARAQRVARAAMVGVPAAGLYLADTGVEGRERHQRWATCDGAVVLAPPRNDRKLVWPWKWRTWHARLRQIVEVVHGKWTEALRLDDERTHTLDGFLVRFAALAALHNACIWINRSLGRDPLAFANLVDW